jgi:hypothetical protein
VRISDVRNYAPYYFAMHMKKFPCVMNVDFKDCPGTIEIGNASYLKRDTIHPPRVIVKFNTSRTVSAFKFSEHCPGASTPWESMEVEPIPNIFQFTANGHYQKIQVDSRRITNYTIYIIPLRPE